MKLYLSIFVPILFYAFGLEKDDHWVNVQYATELNCVMLKLRQHPWLWSIWWWSSYRSDNVTCTFTTPLPLHWRNSRATRS